MEALGRWYQDLGSHCDRSTRDSDGCDRLGTSGDPDRERKHVLVIGGGVSGLTTAWKLLESGFKVTVLAKEYAPSTPRIVSQIAGALWEWPPAVCGKHTDATSLERSKKWCMVSYEHFARMAQDPVLSRSTGVRMRVATFFFDKPISADPELDHKVQELTNSGVKGVRHDFELIEEELGKGAHPELQDAYQHLAPIIDTDTYMLWLRRHVAGLGAELLLGEIKHSLLDIEHELLDQYNADAIVNCTGLGAILTAGDKNVYPLRGCLIRVKNDGSSMPKVSRALCVPHDNSRAGSGNSENLVFIVPRSENVLILGGSVEPNEWDTNLNLDNSALVRAMLARCVSFLPCLKNAEVYKDYPVAVGLRPFRKGNVRVESAAASDTLKYSGSRVVHNYGHGGSGFTLSHGCAEEVVSIVQDMLETGAPKFLRMINYKLPGTDFCFMGVMRSVRKTKYSSDHACVGSVRRLLGGLVLKHDSLIDHLCSLRSGKCLGSIRYSLKV